MPIELSLMMVPERPPGLLTPEQLKRNQERNKLLMQLDDEYLRQNEVPSWWAGKLIGLFAVCLGLECIFWLTILTPAAGLSYYLNIFLKFAETISIIGLAGIAIYQTIAGKRFEDRKREMLAPYQEGL